MWVADHFYLISHGSVKLQLVTPVWNSVNHLINFHANLFLIWEFVFNTYFSCDIVCKSCVAYRFFSLGKATEGPAGATRGGLERATEGPRPSVQAPGLEPGRVRSPAGSRTNRATLGLLIDIGS